MSYCAQIIENNIYFKREDIIKLMKKVKKDIKNGKIKADRAFKEEVLACKNPAELFEAFGFELDEDETSYFLSDEVELIINRYELPFLQSVAEFANDGYIEYSGEDGKRWRYVFKNGQCKKITPKIIWE